MDDLITITELVELAQIDADDYDREYLLSIVEAISASVRKWTGQRWASEAYTDEKSRAVVTKAGYLRVTFQHTPIISVEAIRRVIGGASSVELDIDELIVFEAEGYALLPWFQGTCQALGTVTYWKGGGWEPGDSFLVSTDYHAGMLPPPPVKLATAWLVKETLYLDNPELFPNDPNPGAVESFRIGDYAETRSPSGSLAHVTGTIGRGTLLAAGAEMLLAPYRKAGVLWL